MYPASPSLGRSHVRDLGLVLGLVGTAALAFAPQALAIQNGDQPVAVDDFGTVDISVQDADLAQVLQMLSIESRKNIITSKSASGTVTANLYGVNFYEALRTILRMNDLDYEEDDGFIYVYTRPELEEIKAARRKRESRIFVLDYLAAVDAIEFIAPLLSESGRASARGEVQPGFVPSTSNGGEDSYAFAATVVVNDYAENLDAIASLIDELDVPPRQVMVDATILSAKVSENDAFGVDFSVVGSINFAELANPLAAVSNLLEGNDEGPDVKATSDSGFQPGDNRAYSVVSTPGNVRGPATLKVGIISDDISVFLRVLDEVTDTVVLSRPRVMALNRQRAQVLVGARIGYLSTTSTETTTTQTVQFLDTGINLTFRPFISREGTIRLELRPSVSEAVLRDIVSADGLIVSIPDELTNEVTTNVRVKDGETLVLGGLFRESTKNTRRQVPYLGDIPVIGAAFKGYDDTVARDEIIFLITPSIVKDQLAAKVGLEALKLIEDVRVGAREGLLPFSRSKITADYNRDAVEAWSKGDTEKALYYVNNSLRADPSQAEMIRLRDEILRTNSAATNRPSLFDMIYDSAGQAQPGPQTNAAPPADPLASRDRYINVPDPNVAVASGTTSTGSSTSFTDEGWGPSSNPPVVPATSAFAAGPDPHVNVETIAGPPVTTASAPGDAIEPVDPSWLENAVAPLLTAAGQSGSAPVVDQVNETPGAITPVSEGPFMPATSGQPFAWNPWIRLWWPNPASSPEQAPHQIRHVSVDESNDNN